MCVEKHINTVNIQINVHVCVFECVGVWVCVLWVYGCKWVCPQHRHRLVAISCILDTHCVCRGERASCVVCSEGVVCDVWWGDMCGKRTACAHARARVLCLICVPRYNSLSECVLKNMV